jgi:CBS domain-containing protein
MEDLMPMHRFLEWHASEFMTKNVRTVPPTMTLSELGELFDENDFNSFPVVDDGELVGIVTKLDYLKAFLFDTGHLVPHYNQVMKFPVSKVMNRDVVHADPETPLTRVLELMVKLRTRGVPVIDKGKLVGVVSRTDLMHALTKATKEDKKTRV